jgi:integrase
MTPALAVVLTVAAVTRRARWRRSAASRAASAGGTAVAVSKMLVHASFVTTLTVYADYYITEGDGGKAAPLRRPTAGGLTGNVVPMRRPG